MKIINTEEFLKVSISYSLKDKFRDTFKTAKWDSYAKTWNVKNTTANKNKLEKFQALLDETGVEKLAESTEEVAIDEVAERKLKNELSELKDTFGSLDKLLSRHLELQEKLKSISEKIDQKNKEIEEKNKMVEEVVKSNDEKLNSILANYKYSDGSYIECSVQEAVDLGAKYFNYIKAGYRGNNAEKFAEIQNFLSDTYDDILEKYGIEFVVLNECYRANKNRHDRDYHWFTNKVINPKYVKID